MNEWDVKVSGGAERDSRAAFVGEIQERATIVQWWLDVAYLVRVQQGSDSSTPVIPGPLAPAQQYRPPPRINDGHIQ